MFTTPGGGTFAAVAPSPQRDLRFREPSVVTVCARPRGTWFVLAAAAELNRVLRAGAGATVLGTNEPKTKPETLGYAVPRRKNEVRTEKMHVFQKNHKAAAN